MLEKQLPRTPRILIPSERMARSCPPNTAAASLRFLTFLILFADPNYERDEELSEWIGDDFEPEAFSRRLSQSQAYTQAPPFHHDREIA
jgi:hypothetical protein